VGLDRQVYTWSANNNKVVKLWEAEEGESIGSVAFGGNFLAVGDSQGNVRLFDVAR
jgi:WD40 repeat protein